MSELQHSEQSDSQVVGYTVTQTWCLSCAPEGARDYGARVKTEATYEAHGWGYGWCDICGEELKSHEHEWGPWIVYGPLNVGDPAFDKERRLGRHCTVDGCDAFEEHAYDPAMVESGCSS